MRAGPTTDPDGGASQDCHRLKGETDVHDRLGVHPARRWQSVAPGARDQSALNPDVRTIAAVALHARGPLSRDPHLLAQAVELFDERRPLALASALEDLGSFASSRNAPTRGSTRSGER